MLAVPDEAAALLSLVFGSLLGWPPSPAKTVQLDGKKQNISVVDLLQKLLTCSSIVFLIHVSSIKEHICDSLIVTMQLQLFLYLSILLSIICYQTYFSCFLT